MFMDLPRPTIIAHRGSSAYAPENTLAAFDLAIKQKTNAIELDVKLSADGHVIVIHDQTVDRTTNGYGRVRDKSLLDLKELDAGCSFDRSFCGERIPTLDEVFSSCGDKTFLNIELSNYTNPINSLPYKVAQSITNHKMGHRVLISSFNPIALITFHRHLPEVPFGILAYPGQSKIWLSWPLIRFIKFHSIHAPEQDVSPPLINRVHQAGKIIYVYTVNNSESIQRLFNWGVDGIFTDAPPLALKILSNMGNS